MLLPISSKSMLKDSELKHVKAMISGPILIMNVKMKKAEPNEQMVSLNL